MGDDPGQAVGGPLLEVGRIGKAHGLNGEVSVDFTTDRLTERTTPGVELLADERLLRVVTARPHQKRWLVRFEGVDDRNQAETLRGLTLRAVAIDDDDEVFVHELIGKSLVDQYGTDHGAIVAVVENPASDLLELGDGRLVPLAFYVGDDDDTVMVSVPAGLLDDGPIIDPT
ncbi:MAG: 16S rRNA processing protein RimM [Actinomycetia bacterium]|nr:16S rRNA processing protein RimM [Actinomycetes bacterium]